MSSAIDENIERLEKAAKLFSDTMSVVMEIENRIKGREEKRSAMDAIIELADAVFVNIQDIDTPIGVLEKLAAGGGTLTQPDAGRLESDELRHGKSEPDRRNFGNSERNSGFTVPRSEGALAFYGKPV